jgi:hypothetical protein
MSTSSRTALSLIQLRRAAFSCLGIAAFANAAQSTAPTRPHSDNAPATAAPFNWIGAFHLLGTGFSNGTRTATMAVRKTGAELSINVAGPPGAIASSKIAGDSATFVWDFQQGGDMMEAAMVGVGDSVFGKWRIGTDTGSIIGTRVR